MLKYLLLLLFVIPSTSLALNMETERKYFTNHSFTYTKEEQKKEDYRGRLIKNSYPSNIASPADNYFLFSVENNIRKVVSKDLFEINYYIAPILATNSKSLRRDCYLNLNNIEIDSRFFTIPKIVDNSIVENQYDILPAEAIYNDVLIESLEENTEYYTIENNRKIAYPRNQALQKSFKICIDYVYDKNANNVKEQTVITVKVKDSQALEQVHEVIRRSIFGAGDKATIDIYEENKRIDNVKNPPKATKTINNPINYSNFLVFVPLAIIILLVLVKILRSRK